MEEKILSLVISKMELKSEAADRAPQTARKCFPSLKEGERKIPSV